MLRAASLARVMDGVQISYVGCVVSECRRPFEAIETIEFVLDSAGALRYSAVIPVCRYHRRKLVESKAARFSVGTLTHDSACRYSDDGGWDCAPDCKINVRGQHGV